MPIGQALTYLMHERGIDEHTELAAAADVTPATISRYISGKRGHHLDPRSLRTVEKLARALSVDPEYFLEYRQAKAERLVWEAMAEGLISLEALEMIIEGARVRKGDEELDSP